MILLAGALDYAGLFPPAGLGMAEAVSRYACYRRGPAAQRALLGRFVVPLARLDELAAAVRDLPGGSGEPWELSVLGESDPRTEPERIADVTAGPHPLVVRSVERKVASADDVEEVVAAHRPGRAPWSLYLEVPIGSPALIEAVAAAGAYAKARTGGTTVEAFPASDTLARFLLACSARGVPAKATAGLHHAVRGEHHVTYEAGSPCATMHGFLNVFVAAALLDAGRVGAAELAAVLEERDPTSFDVGPALAGGVRWRDRSATAEQVRRARTQLLHAFGTCSFEEPVAELRALGALP